MHVTRLWIPNGDFGTLATVGWMRRLARSGSTDPLVRYTASAIVREVPGKDAMGQARAIRSWLSEWTQFLRDPNGTELLHSPRHLLSVLRQTRLPLRIDCDDVAVLGAALGGAVGLRARFVIVGFLSPDAPFRHVWADLAPPLGTTVGTPVWVDLDVTRSAQALPSFNAISRTRAIEVF
jgi:hypothetical protein